MATAKKKTKARAKPESKTAPEAEKPPEPATQAVRVTLPVPAAGLVTSEGRVNSGLVVTLPQAEAQRFINSGLCCDVETND